MSKFDLYPAIDIRGGRCVRLLQGDYEKETVYGDSPAAMAEHFQKAGASWIHMVDLDGAREKQRINHAHIVEAARSLNVNIQAGGGIRSEEDVAYYLERGVGRVILGSVALHHPDFAKDMLSRYGGSRIAIGLDARDGRIAVNGWLETSDVTAVALGRKMVEYGAETFIFTDISKDGMMEGPNVKATAELARETGAEVIASGGVSRLEDVRELAARSGDGIAGAITGKAVYTGQLDLEEALQEVNRP
ncbi:1-(5-phosphoribosyl)-5-[(5-phosphoribosylamino)methylideneamino]imidazole-4-carboxamide isomerase [Salibacterium qingdaonense]|uniref:1-(5-phosphoribosyl)-5-[(5-phosphoribosylamino)methylideneamino] imidazole-4-carboxamide isomerase n=1 Tax=Salibacterium qingdaonense TaxID=266892 RepID=A0A1I4KWX2_9BACI|nr:1-(5-phosphoribosyl)-5-[(5-phosphoribosylamino)methylideneamino]imidazole-4-carboxamide isomerase [Salibacterium qingdaonense]SFL83248.1 1-(5-phosphoribosyl)-5-[(5-phosphoribosylamino)methylideneamino] imidazole-4-carboxamide isomerase [Salibacterium qingdaonense]